MKYLAILISFLLPAIALAADYEPLVGLPGPGGTAFNPNSSNFDTYINTLYALSISIAALLAVIKIIIAGVKWMLTDIVTSKSEAKSDIRGALLGLIIVLGAVLILTVINPEITKVNVSLDTVSVPDLSSSVVVLDTSLVQSDFNLEWMPASAGADQINAFKLECTKDAATTNNIYEEIDNSARCYQPGGVARTAYTKVYCNPPMDAAACALALTAATNNCTNFNNGDFYLDPEFPGKWFYCIRDN